MDETVSLIYEWYLESGILRELDNDGFRFVLWSRRLLPVIPESDSCVSTRHPYYQPLQTTVVEIQKHYGLNSP